MFSLNSIYPLPQDGALCMYVCKNLFKVGQVYINVNKKHLAVQ